MKSKKRIPADGDPTEWSRPFASLKESLKDLNVAKTPDAIPPSLAPNAPSPPTPKKNRGRVDIIRQTAHRGGKTVTVVTNFPSLGPDEKEWLRKAMQKACGAGGTIKEGRIEIQGDHRETVARILTDAGFRPVFAGG